MLLSELAKLKESEDKVEFKAATKDFSYAGSAHLDQNERRKCFLGYVVAFSNEGGGRLILGMADKYPHKVVGTQFVNGEIGAITDETYTRLGIRININEIIENGLRVLVVNVPAKPVGKTMKFEGIPLMRIGESLRNMSDEEIYKIVSEQEPDFSAKICGSLQLDELDSAAIEKMKVAYAKKQSNPSFVSLSTEQVLSDMKLYSHKKLNYAALILLGRREIIEKYLPQSKVIWEFRYTDAQIGYDFRETINDPLFLGIDKIWSLINDKNGTIPIRSEAYIFNVSAFNEDVIRESILNAITHRDYTINSEVVIRQYPKKIIVNNPGGFPKGVTIDNILNVSSTPRSRLMAEVLEKTGLVERSGQGVDKIFAITLSEGKPEPSYRDSDFFQVTLKLWGEIQDKAFHIFLSQVQSNRPDNQKLGVEQIVALYKIKQGLFNQVNPEILNTLEKESLVVRLTGHTNRYTLHNDYYQLSSNSQRIKSRYLVAEVTLFVLALQGSKRAIKELELALSSSLNRNQIRYLIQKLLDDQIILTEGTGKGTKYKLSDEIENLKGDMLANEVISKLLSKYV